MKLEVNRERVKILMFDPRLDIGVLRELPGSLCQSIEVRLVMLLP